MTSETRRLLFISTFLFIIACSESAQEEPSSSTTDSTDLPLVLPAPEPDDEPGGELRSRSNPTRANPSTLDLLEIEDREFLAQHLLQRLTAVKTEADFEDLFELISPSESLHLMIELPMYGKELPVESDQFSSFEHFLRCLHGQVELGLCGTTDTLESLLFDHQGLVVEELRSCRDKCCHFGYRDPVEEQLTLRQICFERTDEGRMAIESLTLAAP